MKPENRFRLSVHKFLPPPKELHHEKMSNSYSSGTADDWYSGSGGDLWIEYKFLARVPQRAIVWLVNPNVKKPIMSALQQKWLSGRYAEGRNVGVIIGCPVGGVILRDLRWDYPITPQEFAKWLMPRDQIATWLMKETLRK